MPVYECRSCSSLHRSNGKPSVTCGCGGPVDRRPPWNRIDDVTALFD